MSSMIVEILSVVDTRHYEEQGDRWVPIPGSGLEHDCARCGRAHEVHAEVRLADGSRVIVGTGCMNADGMEIASRARSAERTAKSLARARAEYAVALARYRAYEVARTEVDTLPPPPIESVERTLSNGKRILTLRMGDAEVWCCYTRGPDEEAERRSTLLSLWRDRRMAERGFPSWVPQPDQLAKHVAKLEARLRGMIERSAS